MSWRSLLKPRNHPRDIERLQWVLAFLRQDLETLTPEELVAIGDALQRATSWPAEVPGKPKQPYPEMPAAQVRALQQEIRRGLHAVLAESVSWDEMRMMSSGHKAPGGWAIPQVKTHHIVRVRLDPDGHDCRIFPVEEDTTPDRRVVKGVVTLLYMLGHRLLPCRVCGTPFLRQYRQEYCSVRCSNKVRNKRRLDKQARQRQRATRRRVARAQGASGGEAR
jgi:hypothetical protein